MIITFYDKSEKEIYVLCVCGCKSFFYGISTYKNVYNTPARSGTSAVIARAERDNRLIMRFSAVAEFSDWTKSL